MKQQMPSAEVDNATAESETPIAPQKRGMFGRLAGGTFNYGLGNFLPKVIGFLLIPLYTAYLSPTDYGVLDLATALGATLLILMRCGVPGAVTRFYFDFDDKQALSDYVTTIARTVNTSSLLVGVLAVAIAPWTIVPWMELPLYPFVLLVVAIQLLSSNSDLQRRLIQAREQSAYSAKLSVAYSLASIALTVLFVVGFGWGVVGMLEAQLICSALFFLQALHYLWPDLGGRFRRSMLRSSFAYGLGILPSHILSTASPLLTRVILTQADSLAAVGLFGLANRIASPLTGLLVPAFNMAYLPLYFSIRKEATQTGLTQLATMSRHVWLAALACFLGVALLGPPAIILLTPEHYHPAIPLVPVLSASFLAQTLYMLLGPEIFYAKRTWLVPVVSAAGMVVTLGMSAALAPAYGALGIAWATTFGSIVATITAVYFSLQTVSIPHDWFGLARAACVAIVLFFCGYLTAGDTAWRQAATGTVALAAFPLLLWLVGDQAIRESFHFARSFISGKAGDIA